MTEGGNLASHLSTRLTWHDTGWDGRVCADPIANVSCLVHAHIRDSRDDAQEVANQGRLLSEIAYRPPCSRDPGAYSPTAYALTHKDPLERDFLKPVDEEIPPYSFSTSPYGRMFREDGRWESDPDKQEARLADFFGQLEPQRSLVFFYLKDGQPFIETGQRIVAGVGRVSRVGAQVFFEGKDTNGRRYPVWERLISQKFPDEGFRLPLQEYNRLGLDAGPILVAVPESLTSAFSYVAELVSDDAAVTIIERVLESVRNVKIDAKVAGNWQHQIDWLEAVLGEVWKDRGAYPGIAAVLRFLGFSSAASFHKNVVAPLVRQGKDAWGFLEAILNGGADPVLPPYTHALLQARSRWASEPSSRRDLLQSLARIDLSPEQMERALNPILRAAAGIAASDEDIAGNPYLLVEQDEGAKESEPIGFGAVDQGLLPSLPPVGSHEDAIAKDDIRRLRAMLGEVLEAAAAEGDTLLTLNEAIIRVKKLLPESRRVTPDPVHIEAQREFFEHTLRFIDAPSGRLVGLRSLVEDEMLVRDRLEKMIAKTYAGIQIEWTDILSAALAGTGTQMASEDEAKARAEKSDGLARAISCRLSVITGRAGTGKTTVARALLDGIEREEGKTSMLLLAPTGKARIRLQEMAGRDAKTIHQVLSEQGWLARDTYAIRRDGGQQTGAATILIDEASMLPIDLLAGLFRAINFNQVRRLVFVGDPNQLPPIGPGRPFADLIGWLEGEELRRTHLVQLKLRGRFSTKESMALRLSDNYASGALSVGDDEVLSRVARGDTEGSDLEVHYWNDPRELMPVLHDRVAKLALAGAEAGDYRKLNDSFKSDGAKVAPETWQILSPVRRQPFGTDEINRRFQLEYHRSMLEMSKNGRYLGGHRLPKPIGEQQIVLNDKVIQLVNEGRAAWDEAARKEDRHFVANGEVGLVTWAEHFQKGGDQLQVVFGTQRGLRFKYWRSQVDDRLELAYAITVHKSQGSDFRKVFLVLPLEAATLSRELIYTALTRFRDQLVLLLQTDVRCLEKYLRPDQSETISRNTNLFSLAMRPETVGFPHPEALIHRTLKGNLVRSKSEVIVADTLTHLGIDYAYEQRLPSRDNANDFRLPDFTIYYEGDVWFWEHLGMLSVPSYKEDWERKRDWYRRNGYLDRVLTSQDGEDGSIDAQAIEKTARDGVLAGLA